MTMNHEHIRTQIRGSAVEVGLLAVHHVGDEAHLSTIEAAIPDGNQADAVHIAQHLRDLGLAEKEHSMAGEVTLTYDGWVLAQKIQQSRLNGPDRWDAVERAIIADLLVARTRNGSNWGVHTVDGRDIEPAERVNAIQRLSD